MKTEPVRFLLPVEAVAVVDHSALFKSSGHLVDGLSFREHHRVCGGMLADIKGVDCEALNILDRRYIVRKAWYLP